MGRGILECPLVYNYYYMASVCLCEIFNAALEKDKRLEKIM